MILSPSPDSHPELGVRLKILFGRHYTAADFAKLGSLLDGTDGQGEADVYCPERLGWDRQYICETQRVSDGISTTDELQNLDRTQSGIHALNLIRGTHIRIIMVDIPLEHHLVAQHRKSFYTDNKDLALMHFIDGEFDKALEMHKRCSKQEAQAHKEREAHIERQFGQLLKISHEQRKKIVAVANLGVGHADMRLKLGENFEIISVFDGPPDLRSVDNELIRHLIRGEACSDELFARSQFEALFNGAFLRDLSDEGYKVTLVGRRLIEKLSLNDFRNFSELLGKIDIGYSTNRFKGIDAYNIPIKEELKKLGVHIPASAEEFETLYAELTSSCNQVTEPK